MKFYYNMNDLHNEPHEYYTQESIRKVRIYPATPKLDKIFETDDHCSLWYVHDPYNWCSTEAVECKDIDEAYDYLLAAQNQSVYEYIHDL